jgi:transcriptional antiterminator NusG
MPGRAEGNTRSDRAEAPTRNTVTDTTGGASREAGTAMKWYVIQTYSGYENKVKAALQERIAASGLAAYFGEVLIPTENVVEFLGGQKRTSSRKFFPGYIFIQMELREDTWHLVKSTPKVASFIGHQTPAAVPEEQIKRVTQQMAEGAIKPKPRMEFQEGDTVRVVDGPFANFTGTIDEMRPDKQKVRVKVSIFGRPTPVELDYVQVEKT